MKKAVTRIVKKETYVPEFDVLDISNEILLCLFIIGAYKWGRYFFEIMLK